MTKQHKYLGPTGPGCMIFFWASMEVLFMAFFGFFLPGEFWRLLGFSLLCSILFWGAIGLVLRYGAKFSPEELTSQEIMNITWSDRHAAIVRELVSDDIGRDSNKTLHKFKKGWDTKRLVREHEQLEKEAERIFRERERRWRG